MSAEPRQLFLSVVMVVRNQAEQIEKLLRETIACIEPLVQNYEIILVDNCSSDDSRALYKKLVRADGLPNLQIYSLSRRNNFARAAQLGLENSLGDYVVALDPEIHTIEPVREILENNLDEADIVFARNSVRPKQSMAYRFGMFVFRVLGKMLGNRTGKKNLDAYIFMNKRLVNFVLAQARPDLAYSALHIMEGFDKREVVYQHPLPRSRKYKLRDNFSRGIDLLIFSSNKPMRFASALCLLGSAFNLFYSAYVVFILFSKTDIAPGWVTLSLQQSGMFFLISLILFFISEYIIYIHSLNNQDASYHVALELFSEKVQHLSELNVETKDKKV